MSNEHEAPLKTNVTIRLLAGEMIFAESHDPVLWQRVLGWMTAKEDTHPDLPDSGDTQELPGESSGPLDRFARELEIGKDILLGALSPTDEAPFLHLDTRTWEAFKKNFPPRGALSVPPIALSATALVLWFRHSELGSPTQQQTLDVLGTIHLVDKNASRGIKNCDWLQMRSGHIVLNPAEVTRAVQILKAFCLKQSYKDKTS